MTTPVCFQVPPIDKDEVLAIKALGAGDATPYQQKLALKVIVNKFSRAHDIQFVPDSPGQSAVLSGRAFVGASVLKYLNIEIGKLQNEDQPNDNQT